LASLYAAFASLASTTLPTFFSALYAL